MSPRSAALAAALLAPFLLPVPAQALEKCIAPDGSVSYVDRCPAGTTRAPSKTDEQLVPKVPPKPVITLPGLKPLEQVMKPVPDPSAPPKPAPGPAVPGAPAPILQGPPADVKVEYYEVQARDQPSLVEALNAHPGGHAASSWNLSYQYQPLRDKGQCGVGAVSTKLDLAMTLPRWTPPSGTSLELVERWEKYVNALASHENARLERAREMDRALKPALQALPIAPDCKALDAEVQKRYGELQAESRREVPVAKGPVFE